MSRPAADAAVSQQQQQQQQTDPLHQLTRLPPCHDHARNCFQRLSGSRLGPDERLSVVDAARVALRNLFTETSPETTALGVALCLDVLQNGPNDSRRLVCQTLCAWYSDDLQRQRHHPAELVLQEQRALADALVQSINRSLRKSKVCASAGPPSQLSASALRTAASALKALHALLIAYATSPRQAAPSSASIDPASIMDTLLVSVFFGLTDGGPAPPQAQAQRDLRRIGTAHTSRFGSPGPHAGALSFRSDPARTSSNTSTRQKQPSLHSSASPDSMATLTKSGGERLSLARDSAYDTDASTVAGYSESEGESLAASSARGSGSDGSASTQHYVGRSTVTSAEEERKRASAARAVRQNSLHCLIALNRLAPRALYSYWPSLFPDGISLASGSSSAASAASTSTAAATAAAATAPLNSTHMMAFRPTGSPLAHSGQRSLFTLVRQESSLAIRLTAIEALTALLSGGQAYLGIAQQRSDRMPAFTSLSAKVAALIVDLRACLLESLQVAALGQTTSLPSSSQRSDAELASSSGAVLVLSLLRLTKTFALSTSRARLFVSNAEMLQPVVFKLCSHADSGVTAAAYSAMAALATNPTGASSAGFAKIDSSTSIDNTGVVSGLFAKLEAGLDSDVNTIQLWRTLALYIGPQIGNLGRRELARSIALCEDGLKRSAGSRNTDDRLAVAEYLSALLTGLTLLPTPERELLLLELRNDAAAPSFARSSDRLWALLTCISRDPAVAVRKVAAGALPAWATLRQGSGAFDSERLEELVTNLLHTLSHDEEDAVRAETIRSLGHIIGVRVPSSPGELGEPGTVSGGGGSSISSLGAAEGPICNALLWRSGGVNGHLLPSPQSSLIAALSDRSTLVRQQAAWTLANWTEAFANALPTESAPLENSLAPNVGSAPWVDMARAALRARTDEPAVAVGALRACGCLLAMRSSFAAAVEGDVGASTANDVANKLTLELVDAICAVLEPLAATKAEGGRAPSRSPKMHWNAASALGRAVKNRKLFEWLSGSDDEGAAGDRREALSRLLSVLGDSLASKIFKVKIAAAEALLTLRSPQERGDGVEQPGVGAEADSTVLRAATVSNLASKIAAANDHLEGEIDRASFKEASLYAQECRKLFERLMRAYGLPREEEEGAKMLTGAVDA